MANRMAPPWMQEEANDTSQPEMIVVHMNPGELEGLDNLQGGPSIDPDTGIREYSALGEIIEIPEVRDIFKRVSQEIDTHGDISPGMKEIYESTEKHSLPYVETPEEKHNPLKDLEHEGREGDTKLALIPLNLAMFLIELRHEPSVNPKTGLLEFKFKLKKIFRPVTKFVHSVVKNPIRTAGTIAGALLGGPMGMGIGNAIGGVASGKPIKKALMTGLQVGGLGYGLQGVGQAAGLSSATPYTGGFFGGGPNLVAQGLGKVGIGAAAPTATASSAATAAAPAGMMAAGQHGAPGTIGSSHVYYPETFTPASAGYGEYAGPLAMGAGAGMMNMRGNQPQTGMSSGNSYMDSINSGILDLLKNPSTYGALGMAGLGYVGSQKQQKREKKAEKEASGRLERERERMGFYEPWRPVTETRRRRNPRFGSESDLHSRYGIGYEPAFLDEEEGYAKGGSVRTRNLVKGPGKGQDDKIKTSVPDGTYIEDASSTSMFGDGSSEAGAKILRDFEKKINGRFSKKTQKSFPRNHSKVPVWLSNGEYAFSPETVTRLGGGSNTKGAELLKKMTINLRRHKASHGGGLPPKAKPPTHYLPR